MYTICSHLFHPPLPPPNLPGPELSCTSVRGRTDVRESFPTLQKCNFCIEYIRRIYIYLRRIRKTEEVLRQIACGQRLLLNLTQVRISLRQNHTVSLRIEPVHMAGIPGGSIQPEGDIQPERTVPDRVQIQGQLA